MDEPPRKEPQSATVATRHRATDASQWGTTDVSPSLSATDVSPLKAGKGVTEMQAEHAPACETTSIIRPHPACPSPEKAKAEPLTPQESEVMDQLRWLQRDLRIDGSIEASTVREVLKVVALEDLPKALRLVADKVADRRRRDHHYRERIDFGLVLTILRQDYPRPGQANMPFLKRKDISAASAA